MKYLAIFALVLIASPCLAQDTLADQVAVLKANNTAINARFTVLEGKVDALSAKVDTLLGVKATAATADPFSPTQAKVPGSMCPGCTCGCATTGVCTCATMQAKASPVVQYRTICGPNGCSIVPVSASDVGTGTVYFSDSFGDSVAASGGRVGPIRRIFQRIFRGRGGSGGCGTGGCQ